MKMNVLWMCCAPQLPSFPVAKLTYVPTNNNDIVWQTLGRVGNALPTTIAWRAVARRFWIKHAVACLDLTPNAGGGSIMSESSSCWPLLTDSPWSENAPRNTCMPLGGGGIGAGYLNPPTPSVAFVFWRTAEIPFRPKS